MRTHTPLATAGPGRLAPPAPAAVGFTGGMGGLRPRPRVGGRRPGGRRRLALPAAGVALAMAAALVGVGAPGVQPGESPAAAVSAASGAAAQAASGVPGDLLGGLPLAFEANRGQTDGRVDFLARAAGYTAFVTPTGVMLALSGDSGAGEAAGAAVEMRLVGADPDATATGADQLAGTVSYLIGEDPDAHVTGAPTYEQVVYGDVYPGVDVAYLGDDGALRYDFVVAPGADPDAITLAFDGADSIAIADDGALVVDTPAGAMRHAAPVAYQDIDGHRLPVDAGYTVDGGQVGFAVDGYEPAYPLVIDPTVDYATFLGGSGHDVIEGLAVDAEGGTYVVGFTNSLDFPTTAGAFQEEWPGDDDASFGSAFVAKLVPGGGQEGAVALEWSTYLGGSTGYVHGFDVVVGDDGVVHVAGITESDDFPLTDDAHDREPPDRSKGFVTLLNADGAGLVHSTYYAERIAAMAVDAAGMVYVAEERAGGVARIDLSAGAGAGAVDRIVLGERYVKAVIVDDHGYVYAMGSRGIIEATAGAYQAEPVGGWLVKLAWPAEGLGADPLVYATYGVYGEALAWNPRDDTVFVAGRFGGALVGDHAWEAPKTLGALQTEHSRFLANHGHDVSIREATLREFDLAGNGEADQVYATMFGGAWTDEAFALAATPEGTVWVAGATQSGDFAHITEGALAAESGFGGRFAAGGGHGGSGTAGVVLHIDPAGRGEGDLLYGTTFGGAPSVGLRWAGIDLAPDGAVTVAGGANPPFGLESGWETLQPPPTHNALRDTPEGPEGFVLRFHPGQGDAQIGVPGDTQPRVDGVEVGLVGDIHPDGSSQRPGPAAGLPGAAGVAADPTVVGDTLFFTAYHPDHGRELWKTDGTPAGTTLVKDIVEGGDSRPQVLTAAGDSLFFTADHPDYGRELWTSDGTEAGTVLVKDVYPGLTSSPVNMAAVGDAVFFDPLHPDHGQHSYGFAARALWRSDGTEAGTELVKDPSPDHGSQLHRMTATDDRLFVAVAPATSSVGLWVSDGTTAGTYSVLDYALSPDPTPRQITAFGDGVLFTADSAQGRELWHSDGTEEGTGLVVDLNPDGSSIPLGISPVGDIAFFSAFTGVEEDDPHTPPSSVSAQDEHEGSGRELWATDGTAAGTRLVADVNPGGSSHPAGMTAIGDTVVFAATDATHGRELWRTAADGSGDDTALVADINPGGSSEPEELVAVGGTVFFTADDGQHGRELWMTDGTEAGTRLVMDLRDGEPPALPEFTGFAEHSSLPERLTAFDGAVYFTAHDGEHGRELWRAQVTVGALTGEVTDADTDAPVAGAQVTVTDGGGTAVDSDVTVEDGRYRVDGLAPGAYTVAVAADGYDPAESGVTVEAGATLAVDVALDATAPEPGAVTGTVTDADTDAAIAGADVTVTDADGQTVGAVTTGTDGGFQVDGLDAGGYTVSVDADGYEPASAPVAVTAGATATVDLALQPDPDPTDPDPTDPDPTDPDPTDPDPTDPDPTDPDPGEACPPGEVAAAAFTDREDIPTAHRANVDCAAWQEIVQGFADGSYGPTLPVRRDQMASFVARTLDAAGVGLPAPTGQRFTDVAADSPHDEAIHRLAAAGIVQGGPGGLSADAYGPGQQVRRDQMASFLIRAAEHAGHDGLASQTQAFDDVPAANAHFANVNGAANAGLASGFGDGTYRPGADVRRDQMGTFVIRLLESLGHNANSTGI